MSGASPQPPTTTTTVTVVPTPPPATHAAGAAFTGGVVATLLSATVVAALIAGAINLWLARRKTREEERARLRDRFARAFSAYAEYCEFAYAARRRRHDDEAGERVRISEEMRKVQAEIKEHEVWVQLEAATVGAAYTELVEQMRRVAGGSIREAWKQPAPTTDSDMNMPPAVVDLSPLKPYEKAYMDAVADHLHALTPWWSR